MAEGVAHPPEGNEAGRLSPPREHEKEVCNTIDFDKLDRKELAGHGLAFATDEEAKLFGKVIREELEARVGEAITSSADDEELEEFDACRTPEESSAWLEKHCPDIRERILEIKEALYRELMAYRDRIPGVIAQK